jgi:hypothetical protein
MSPVADLVMRRELERCDLEQALIQQRADVLAGTAPAFLVAMGINDWDLERAAILREADPARWPYLWTWNRYLARYRGWPCRVRVRGSLNSALVVFPDGYQVVTSRNGLRKRDTQTTVGANHLGRQGVPVRGATGNPDHVPVHGGAGAAWCRRGQA